MSPAKMRRIVDLPQPLGPMRQTTSLARMSRLMSSSTRSSLPVPRSKDFWTPFSSQMTSWFMFIVSLASLGQGVAGLGQAVERLPHQAVEEDDGSGQHQ